jgi:hypothetical protein
MEFQSMASHYVGLPQDYDIHREWWIAYSSYDLLIETIRILNYSYNRPTYIIVANLIKVISDINYNKV